MTGRRSHYVTDEVPFPPAEYERRLAAVQKRMDDRDLDLLYCTEPESLCYLTGYRNSWFRSHSPRDWTPVTSAVVARDAGRVLFIEVAKDEHLARSTTADAVTQLRLCRRDEEPTGAAFVTHAIDEMGWSGRRIGLERWNHRPSPGFADRLQRAFEAAGYAVTDATGVVRETRVEKSPAELHASQTGRWRRPPSTSNPG